MRSKEKEMNFTDYKHLNCYRYIEENDTIEEAFYQSNDSKFCKFSQPVFYPFFPLSPKHSLRVMIMKIQPTSKGYIIDWKK